MCVLSVSVEGKRHAVGRVLFPLEGELGQAGRVLWRELETEDDTQVCIATTLTSISCGPQAAGTFNVLSFSFSSSFSTSSFFFHPLPPISSSLPLYLSLFCLFPSLLSLPVLLFLFPVQLIFFSLPSSTTSTSSHSCSTPLSSCSCFPSPPLPPALPHLLPLVL